MLPVQEASGIAPFMDYIATRAKKLATKRIQHHQWEKTGLGICLMDANYGWQALEMQIKRRDLRKCERAGIDEAEVVR